MGKEEEAKKSMSVPTIPNNGIPNLLPVSKVLPKPSECFTPTPCPLAILDKAGFSAPSGSGVNKVMMVGEALGANERAKGRPFIEEAEAGSLLENCLKRGGWDRDQFVLWNIVACQPPNNKLLGADYEQEAIEKCKVHFDRVVARFQPKCLLALGAIPLRTLTGMSGSRQGISLTRGFVLNSDRYNIPVVPAFHPSFINRGNKHLKGTLIRDIGLAISVAKLSPVELKANRDKERMPAYILEPTVEQANRWADWVISTGKPLNYDIETYYSTVVDDESEAEATGINSTTITQIQFTINPYEGIVLPHTAEFRPVIAKLLASMMDKWGWNNYVFDDPILRKNGYVINGQIHDLMNAWHHLQPDLPRGLQVATSFYAPWFGPWKHLAGSDLKLYGAKDVDAPCRVGIGLFEDLKARGMFDSYMKYYVRLQPILLATAERGIRVDAEKQAALKDELEKKMAAIDAEVAPLIPIECQPVSYSPKDGYKKLPKDLQEIIISTSGLDNPDMALCMGRARDLGYVWQSKNGNPPRWFKKTVSPFNLNSGAQLISYIEFMGSDKSPLTVAKRKLYKVPTKRGTGKKTVEEDQLRRLANKTEDLVLLKALERKEMSHFVSSFCSPDWQPKADGKIHTTYKSGGTANLQLSAEKPNVQQFPKHGELAKLARKLIIPSPGCKIVRIDYKSFHAQTGSFEAGDADYLRLSKLDIHSYVTAHFMKKPDRFELLPLPDKELKARLTKYKEDEDFKHERDAKVKHAILGINNGMGVNKLYDKYMEFFDSKREATEIMALLRQLFPRFFEWQNEVRRLAHTQGFLMSRYKCIRYFWEVYKRVNGQWVSGESSEEAIAYLLANNAHCHLRERLIEMDDLGYLEKYRLINIIHDELDFDCPIELVDECIRNVTVVMERPSEVMINDICPNGLVIEADVEVGEENWAAWHPINNPGGMKGYELATG